MIAGVEGSVRSVLVRGMMAVVRLQLGFRGLGIRRRSRKGPLVRIRQFPWRYDGAKNVTFKGQRMNNPPLMPIYISLFYVVVKSHDGVVFGCMVVLHFSYKSSPSTSLSMRRHNPSP